MPEEQDAELAARLDRIKKLTEDLIRVQDACDEAKEIAVRIKREVDATRDRLKTP